MADDLDGPEGEVAERLCEHAGAIAAICFLLLAALLAGRCAWVVMR